MKEEGRNKSIFSLITDLKKRADEICEEFSDFTDGYRVLMLLQRTKDGGANDEEKRMFESYTTTNSKEFREKLFNLLLLKETAKVPVRIYLSANPRNPYKVIRFIEQSLIDAHYSDQECKDSIYKKLLKKPRHYLMQQSCKDSSLFIIDVDDIDGIDVMGEAINKIAELNIVEKKRYRTKNGWHIIVEPFNVALWNIPGEVKKDPLILLDY
jgi:hypothetical protein